MAVILGKEEVRVTGKEAAREGAWSADRERLAPADAVGALPSSPSESASRSLNFSVP